jgi:hypothetical protein
MRPEVPCTTRQIGYQCPITLGTMHDLSHASLQGGPPLADRSAPSALDVQGSSRSAFQG